MVGPWFDNVARWSAEAAAEALANLQPVQLRTGRGECHINSNRRAITPAGDRFLGVNPDAPCDREGFVVRLDSLEGQPLATLVNYACHPTIMGPANRLITPDRSEERRVGKECRSRWSP